MELMERTHRLFFALWPSVELRDQLAAAVGPLLEGKHARAIPAANFHITLAFLGAVQARKLPGVMEAASRIEAPALTLSVADIEVWDGARILCLTPEASPLQDLVERLRRNLLARQLEPDRREFRPHVTIAREWRDGNVGGSIGPFEWRAEDFVLVESESAREGSQYRIIGRWPLAQ
jgi:RNA 2',3'-cyclic 3'-phosphodiesterase